MKKGMDDCDMCWTFPTPPLGAEPPSLSHLRSLVVSLCGDLLCRASKGEELLNVANPAFGVPIGWDHWHRHPELFLQVSGKSRFQTPNGDVELSAGRLLLFPPLAAHRESVVGDPSIFRNLVFTLSERSISYHMSEAPFDASTWPRIVLPDILPVEEAMAGSLLWLMGSQDLDVRAGATRAFLGVLRRAAKNSALPGETEPDRVREAQHLVRSRLGSASLSVGQVANWVGCHPDHLTRTFRRETGQTLVGFIVSERLSLGHSLLMDSRMRVVDAARLSGFTDPAYFSRLYRKRYGEPPSRKPAKRTNHNDSAWEAKVRSYAHRTDSRYDRH